MLGQHLAPLTAVLGRQPLFGPLGCLLLQAELVGYGVKGLGKQVPLSQQHLPERTQGEPWPSPTSLHGCNEQ